MKKLKITSVIMAVLLCVFGCDIAPVSFSKTKNTNGIYAEKFTAYAEESILGSATKLFGTRGNKSTDKKYLLLVTAVKADMNAYKEVGYEVSVDEAEPKKYSSDCYYTGISVRTSLEDESARTVYTVASIYADETIDTENMIVAEIEYSIKSGYKIKPYMVSNDDQTIYGGEIAVESDYYQITKKTNSECIADAGVWHYYADGTLGTEYSFNEEPYYVDSMVSTEFNAMPDASSSKYFYFRYQPSEVEVGQYYTINLLVTVSAACELRLASKQSDSSTTAAYTVAIKANTEKAISFVGYCNTAEPFSIRINNKIKAESTKITVKLVGVEANNGTDLPDYQGGTRICDDYSIEKQYNSYVMAHPGKWFYFCDGTAGTDYEFGYVPSYENGTITFAFNKMAEGTPAYQLRYQPTFAEGTSYSVSLKVTLSAAGKVVYGTDYKSKDFTAGETTTITWTGTVQATSTNKPFLIQFRSTDRTAPITMTVSDIVLKEVQ